MNKMGCLIACLLLIGLGACQHPETATHDIHIWTELPIGAEEKQPSTITFTGQTDTISSRIKRRGGSSFGHPKHSYTFKLDGKHSIAGILADNDWILHANYIDKTLMRNRLAYDLWAEMHTENIAAKTAYTTVYLNNEYQGLYVLTERLDATRLLLDKSDSTAMSFKDPPLFYKQELKPHEVQDSTNYHHQKFPKKNRKDQSKHIEHFRYFLKHSADSIFSQEVFSHIDRRNVIDWHIHLLFTNNGDGILKNFYIYKQDSSSLFNIAIWDCDHSLGRDGDNEINRIEVTGAERELELERSLLFYRIMETNPQNYRQELISRYEDLRLNGPLSEYFILERLDTYYEEIEPYLEKNFELHPYDGPFYYDDNTFEMEFELLKKSALNRLLYLDTYFDDFSKSPATSI